METQAETSLSFNVSKLWRRLPSVAITCPMTTHRHESAEHLITQIVTQSPGDRGGTVAQLCQIWQLFAANTGTLGLRTDSCSGDRHKWCKPPSLQKWRLHPPHNSDQLQRRNHEKHTPEEETAVDATRTEMWGCVEAEAERTRCQKQVADIASYSVRKLHQCASTLPDKQKHMTYGDCGKI